MNKESTIGLQKVDCNCNDCVFLVRDLQKFNESLEIHKQWQLDYFNGQKQRLFEAATEHRDKAKRLSNILIKEGKHNEVKELFKEAKKKAKGLEKEANGLRFQFVKKHIAIQYGRCTKFNKDVKFIPNTCQLDTQNCFVHRRDGEIDS